MEGADSSRDGRRDGMVTSPGDGHTVWSRSSQPGWIESTVKSAFTWRKRFRAMVALMRTLREGWCSKRTREYSYNTKREAYIERGFGSAAVLKVEGCSLQAKRS